MFVKKRSDSKMSPTPIIFYLIFLILFDRAVKSQVSSNTNSNAFLEGNNDVRYIVDNIPINVHKDFNGNPGVKVETVEESTNFKSHLKFQPTVLDFKERPLGVPHHEKVTIINLNGNKTVHMSSISGHTVHFHSSFFEDKVIPPLGNTSFNVVFLGREEGEVESNLFIHTSEGSFKYQVRGTSVQSPYRLRPLSGVKLPLNASFSPLIMMHNPYATPLQLVEVYSSGGEFRLELPGGELEGPRHLWEIPAFRTKPIIRVRFHARAQKNHTAYIRLKVNQSEEVLVVPLEVEVGAACGLYSPEDVIDFGIGGSNDAPTTVILSLHNSWKKPIKIHNVISTPVSKALRIDFESVKVPAETDTPIEVARLTFDWDVALETGHTSGRVVVKSKQSTQKLVIPYTATVLAGGLSYDKEITRFRSDSSNIPLQPRTFHLVNNFKVPVAITNVSLPRVAQPYFQLQQFEPRILKSGQSVPLLEIVPTVPPHLVMDSALVIVTNVSSLSVPLLCYDGKLIKVISHRNESEIELGTVGSGTEKQALFALVNENPVPVTITSLETSLPSAVITVAAIRYGNATTFLSQHCLLHNETTQERSVGPGQYAVVRVLVHTGTQVGETQAQVTLRTEYETIEIPAHMRVEHGSLQVTPDPIMFSDCFPGTVCSEVLRVQSLFSVAMAVTAVTGVLGDPRLSFTPASPALLLPASTTDLGTLSFDTGLLDPEDNYLATTHNITGSTRWQDTLELPAHCPEYDLSLLAARYDHFHNLSSRLLNLTLRLDTTEVRDHMFAARVRLMWPVLSADLVFPLTQVGNTTQRTLVITNPGTLQPLMVQLVLENNYPATQSVLDSLPDRLRPLVAADAQPGLGEFVIDTSHSPHKLTQHRDSWVFLLPPSSNTSVQVKFSPSAAHTSSTLLLLRNNLTVLEPVMLTGTGAFTQFKFGNRKPGSATPLLFELAEKHLKDCEREKQRKFPAPNLTVKRSFTARNTGALPISVHGFHISGLSCEGYGFRVLNCEAFHLPPNGTKKVDIAFTPDFTLARVQRTLGVWTSESDNVANYTLVATLPPYLLSSCSQVLARPTWEPLLYYCAVTFMVFLLVCVLAAAFLESDRALKCALLAMSRDNATVQPVLDLKSIGTGVGLNSSGSSNSSNSSGAQHSPQGPDKAETPTSSSWSRHQPAPAPTPIPTHTTTATTLPAAPHEPLEVVKEKVGGESNVAVVFTSPGLVKCARKKEKDKTVVSKRYSDPTDTVATERRSPWAVFTKPAASSSIAKPHVKTLSDSKRKLCKKTSNPGQCVRETTPLQLPSVNSNSDDTETSSTTTESSHDDRDKEVEVVMCETLPSSSSISGAQKTHQKCRVSSGKTKKLSVCASAERNNGGSASSLELEWEDEEPMERETSVKKHHATTSARNRKTAAKNAKSESSQVSQSIRVKNSSSGSGKQCSTRSKEKLALAQKRSAEKQPAHPKPVVFEPVPPPLTLWDDSRASFSDVVARSDTSKHAEQPSTSHHSLSLTLPLSSTSVTAAAVPLAAPAAGPAALGPIGSKKMYSSGWDCWSAPNTTVTGPSNSFFMDSFSDTRPPPPPTVTPAPVVHSPGYDGWKDHDMILKYLQVEEQRRFEAEELQRSTRPVYQDTWSPWSGSAPTAEPVPAPTPAPGLWGSDVWAPPPPPDTWAPPGLAPRPPPRIDDPTNPDLDLGLDYDPFRSLSNIWAPHHPPTNPFWKPPTTNH